MKRKRRESASITAGMAIGAAVVRGHRRLRHFVFQLCTGFSAIVLVFLVSFSIIAPSHISSPPYSPVKEESSVLDLWRTKQSELYYGCSSASQSFVTANMKTHSHRYLLIATSGGLNQQRTGIIDAVVAAYILNATLVVPQLDQKSFWQDSSTFADIFDVDQFISFLSNDVRIVKQLPTKGRGDQATTPYSMRVPRKCSPSCYISRVLPALNKRHVVQLSKFDYRLSNKLSKNLQKLRCRVNYHALKFTDPILNMGKKLVERMTMKNQRFVALHLRYEPDMLAFSGCDYGGGEKERQELGEIRKRWKSLRVSNPEKVRRNGRCPLTPEEVGLMLRALGYGSDVHLYVASGEVYGGEETLAPLKELFPNFHTKDTLASKEELAPFTSFSSRMAALDFIVCDDSDVFVTNNNGNMAKILAGRRRYFGHKRTIRPNAKKLYKLFMNQNNMTWEEFSSGVQTHQIGFMGDPKEMKPGKGEFHENPEACICEAGNVNANRMGLQAQVRDIDKADKEDNNFLNDQTWEDEQSLFDTEYEDNVGLLKNVQLSVMDPEPRALTKTDQPELELLFSD